METKETSASKKSWSHNNKLCKWVSTSQDKNNREMMMLWKKKEGAQKIVEPSLPKVEARVSSSIKSGAKSFCWRVEGIGSISSGYATGNAILPLMSVSRRVCLQQVSHFHFTLQYAHQETEYGIKSTVYVNWLQIRWLFLSLEWHPLSHTIYILFNVYPEVSSSRFPVWEEHLLTWSPGQQSCRRRQSSLAKKWWSVMIVMKWVTAAHSCEVAFWCNFWWNFWRNFNLKEETSSSSDSACLSLFFVFFANFYIREYDIISRVQNTRDSFAKDALCTQQPSCQEKDRQTKWQDSIFLFSWNLLLYSRFCFLQMICSSLRQKHPSWNGNSHSKYASCSYVNVWWSFAIFPWHSGSSCSLVSYRSCSSFVLGRRVKGTFQETQFTLFLSVYFFSIRI